jgi:hypothetical protein
MDGSDATTRAAVLGHLAITTPVVAAVLLVVVWGFSQFGPSLWPYYVTGGFAIAWQWYLMALPRWKGWLNRKGIPENQTEEIALRVV